MRLRTFRQHAGRASDSGATQDIQQNRFRLIVPVMGKRQPVCIATRKYSMAHAACGGFQTFAAIARDIDSHGFQWHVALSAEFDTEPDPCVSVRTDPVMDMQGGKRDRHVAGFYQLA